MRKKLQFVNSSKVKKKLLHTAVKKVRTRGEKIVARYEMRINQIFLWAKNTNPQMYEYTRVRKIWKNPALSGIFPLTLTLALLSPLLNFPLFAANQRYSWCFSILFRSHFKWIICLFHFRCFSEYCTYFCTVPYTCGLEIDMHYEIIIMLMLMGVINVAEQEFRCYFRLQKYP